MTSMKSNQTQLEKIREVLAPWGFGIRKICWDGYGLGHIGFVRLGVDLECQLGVSMVGGSKWLGGLGLIVINSLGWVHHLGGDIIFEKRMAIGWGRRVAVGKGWIVVVVGLFRC
ncbi:unnamed protein product [Prunus armeniaca]|uniref:Uncharacterized protein n=1 Tax=Prunus armeniaca TaxID=36596 RepID=A0A6J5V670_PRUAR|nr:unnamed protein product [Prunus armeniaca]CAB4313702.1 unnamed protein product [Prunus armeniaca]